jgi:hypothetical protein
VRVCDVADVGEVEEVGIFAELEPGLVGVVDVEDWGEDLDVAFAKYTGGADGGC